MSTNIIFPLVPFVDDSGKVSEEWKQWLLNPHTLTANFSVALGVTSGGTGMSSGTSGGIIGFTAATTIGVSSVLTKNALVLGGGAGALPSTPVGLGTTTTVLHGNVAGAPSWSAIDLANDVTGNLGVSHLAGGTGAASNTWWNGSGAWTTPTYSDVGADQAGAAATVQTNLNSLSVLTWLNS